MNGAILSPRVAAFEQIKKLVLDTLPSPESKRAYGNALDDFFRWCETAAVSEFTKAIVNSYRVSLEERSLSPSTINQRLSAIRKLAMEAADNGLMPPNIAPPKHVTVSMFPGWNYRSNICHLLPLHARIHILAASGQFDWFLLEAKLYENLCAVFNQAKELHKSVDSTKSSARKVKTADAFMYSTVVTALNFVEAFLNGLAHDYYLANSKTIDEKTKSELLDWDFRAEKTKFLSLRNKALQYPRIILGLTDPPLQESNCRELKFVLESAVPLRDAIVHPAPELFGELPSRTKERDLISTTFEEMEETVDICLRLVRRIETTIRGNEDRLFWMRDRGENGFFPNSVFE